MAENSVEHAIIRTMREMVLEAPLVKITVLDLCERACVSRNSFYAYFSDKMAVLERIFHDDALAGHEKLLPLFPQEKAPVSSLLLHEIMYQSIFDNAKFYTALASMENEPYFMKLMHTSFTNLHLSLATDTAKLGSDRVLYAAEFNSGGSAYVMLHWVREGMKVSPHELAEWMSAWNMEASWEGFKDTRKRCGVKGK